MKMRYDLEPTTVARIAVALAIAGRRFSNLGMADTSWEMADALNDFNKGFIDTISEAA